MSKFTVATNLLLRELTFINHALGDGKTNPLWASVLLKTEGTHMRATAFNGLNAATSQFILSEPVTENVEVMIDGKKLLEITANISQEKVTFNVTENKVTLTAGKGRFTFSVMPITAAIVSPTFFTSVEGEEFNVGSKAFAEALKVAVMFAAKDDTSKFTLAGVTVKTTDTAVYGLAMDGERAIETTVNDPCAGRDASIFIFKESVALAAGIVDTTPTVMITKGEASMKFVSGNRMALIRRAVTENAPKITANMDKLLSQTISTAEVEASELVGAVRRMQVAGDGKFRKVLFTVEANNMKLLASDLLTATKEFEEDIDAVTNGSGSASLNAPYVLDCLKHVEGKVTVHIVSKDSMIPAIITSPAGIRYLAMQLV